MDLGREPPNVLALEQNNCVRTTLVPSAMGRFPETTIRYMELRHGTESYAPGRTPLLSVPELATLLGVHRVSIYRLPIPYALVGSRRRYRWEDVDAYLEARKVDAG